MFLVTLTAIYAYRSFKEPSNKNYIIFAIASVLSAYTHYYATIAIAIINIALFIAVLKKKDKTIIKKWFIFGIIQLVAFIPGLIILYMQAVRVASGFWISITYPDVFLEILQFPFRGSIENNYIINTFMILIYAYCIYQLIKNRNAVCQDFQKDSSAKDIKKVATIAIGITLAVITAGLLLSIVRDIFVVRYTLPLMGLFVFFIATSLSLEKNKWVSIIVAILIVAVTIFSNITCYQKNYDNDNHTFKTELTKQLTGEDIFIYTDITTGGIAAMYFPEVTQYFYNIEKWTIETAYGAFLPQMKCIEEIETLDLRDKTIWLIGGNVEALSNTLKEKIGFKKNSEIQTYHMPYKNITINVCSGEQAV